MTIASMGASCCHASSDAPMSYASLWRHMRVTSIPNTRAAESLWYYTMIDPFNGGASVFSYFQFIVPRQLRRQCSS